MNWRDSYLTGWQWEAAGPQTLNRPTTLPDIRDKVNMFHWSEVNKGKLVNANIEFIYFIIRFATWMKVLKESSKHLQVNQPILVQLWTIDIQWIFHYWKNVEGSQKNGEKFTLHCYIHCGLRKSLFLCSWPNVLFYRIVFAALIPVFLCFILFLFFLHKNKSV